uniref:Uncharacterized protein n=1 Tax=Sphaerodactylus townsendi TaxID=933632 RepID=A0ACB8EXU3_9SAUR
MYHTKALSVSQKNSTPVVSKLSREVNEFYDHKGHLCRMCPPGNSVLQHCETSGSNSTCKPCSNDSFSTHWNSFHECVPCKVCRPLDQVTLKLCSRTSNAECACKEGAFFCSPSQPCETCHTCKPRCPDGEEMVQPCTPQSDIQCVPITTSSPTVPSGKSDSKAIVPLWILLGIILLIILGCVMYKYRKTLQRSSAPVLQCSRDHTTGTKANSIRSKTLLWLQTKLTRGQPESGDNEWNAQVDLASQSHSGSNTTGQPEETIPLREKECSVLIEEEKGKLVPANGKDAEEALRQSFFLFVDEVPLNKWHSYMSVLGLTYNEIDTAKLNSPGDVAEQHHQMLRKWLDKNGKNASLDTLLKTLCDPTVNLKGVEMRIREALIDRKMYYYEE